MQLQQSNKLYTPKDFQWENRMVIIFGESENKEWFSDKLKKDLSDRKLLVFHFDQNFLISSNFPDQIKESEFLKLKPKNQDQTVSWILVGLDGGIKKSEFSPPKPQEIFKIIDAMPMRQSELSQKK